MSRRSHALVCSHLGRWLATTSAKRRSARRRPSSLRVARRFGRPRSTRWRSWTRDGAPPTVAAGAPSSRAAGPALVTQGAPFLAARTQHHFPCHRSFTTRPPRRRGPGPSRGRCFASGSSRTPCRARGMRPRRGRPKTRGEPVSRGGEMLDPWAEEPPAVPRRPDELVDLTPSTLSMQVGALGNENEWASRVLAMRISAAARANADYELRRDQRLLTVRADGRRTAADERLALVHEDPDVEALALSARLATGLGRVRPRVVARPGAAALRTPVAAHGRAGPRSGLRRAARRGRRPPGRRAVQGRRMTPPARSRCQSPRCPHDALPAGPWCAEHDEAFAAIRAHREHHLQGRLPRGVRVRPRAQAGDPMSLQAQGPAQARRRAQARGEQGRPAARAQRATAPEIRGLDFEFELRWDLDNMLPLCEAYHQAHHSRTRPVPRAVLPEMPSGSRCAWLATPSAPCAPTPQVSAPSTSSRRTPSARSRRRPDPTRPGRARSSPDVPLRWPLDDRERLRYQRRPGPTPDRIRLSAHAIAQYAQRVKPGLPLDAAHGELQRLIVEQWKLVDVAPAWARDASQRPYFLVIAESICLPLAHAHRGRWAATTCLVRGTPTDVKRRQRTRRRPGRVMLVASTSRPCRSRRSPTCWVPAAS